ncbi:MAG: hypothetical protein DYH07_08715 [Armatimonadetes bacterium ATM1]|nr:hypothetical protein [Armatimonadota bacterium]MCE7900158.1 hypothetical protein [Armatimonadetes bacterium ATM1]RIJ95190.1 MAG: hypothetical protein DCC45_11360 [Armatimonadota bacterium]
MPSHVEGSLVEHRHSVYQPSACIGSKEHWTTRLVNGHILRFILDRDAAAVWKAAPVEAEVRLRKLRCADGKHIQEPIIGKSSTPVTELLHC